MPFEKRETAIPGCFELIPRVHSDERGLFVKTFHDEEFRALGLETDFREEYYSVSKKGVLRGLHFQKPPHDHAKVAYCARGRVFDAVLDLRRDSPSFGRYFCSELGAEKANMIYIPKGCAHGFYALSDAAALFYKVTSVYSPGSDSGILWNSAGIPWPGRNPLLSDRDANFETLDQYRAHPVF